MIFTGEGIGCNNVIYNIFIISPFYLIHNTRSFWQGQVADWQASGLTQKAYCEEQGLRYTAFGYWVRKLRREAEPSPGKKPTCFVPVVPDTATGLSLALPNGLEIRGIDSGNLPLVRQLLEVL